MRDDILIIWKQGDLEFDRFFWYLMGIEPRIQFTLGNEKKMESFHLWTFIYAEKMTD